MTKAMDLLNKFAEIESEFFAGNTTFVSPILTRGEMRISTRIENIEYTFSLRTTSRQPGWYALRAVDAKRARIIREANAEEIASYHSVFPKKRVIVVRRNDDGYLGLVTETGSETLIVPIHFADGLEIFDYVDTITDGNSFWFVESYARRDPILLEGMREQFRKNTSKPKSVGWTPDEKKAYGIAYAFAEEARKLALALEEEAKKTQTQRRIESALKQGAASLVDYTERGEAIVVQWEFDGIRHTSTVRKTDLTVMTAGICLSNTDQRFDLASLPSVFREKIRRHGNLSPYHGPDIDDGDDDYDD